MAENTSPTVIELQKQGALLVEDGNHGEYRPRPEEFTDRGVAYIRAADIEDGRVLFGSSQKITETAVKRITKGIGAPGDILLSHKGTVGKIALVPKDAPPFVCSPQTTLWRTTDELRLNRRYLHAFMRSPGFRAQLASRAGETDMAPYVSLTSQRGMSVALPPIKDQIAIADVIGPLDDKIELNRQTNQTLEEAAQAIFKDWFVDFGPVRAKQSNSRRYLPEDLWNLFPKSLHEDIPIGWTLGQLDDLVVLQRGFDLPSAARTPGKFAVFAASGFNGTHNKSMVAGPGVTTGRSGVLGRTFFVHDDFWPLNTSLWVKEYKASSPAHAYFLLQTLNFASFNAGSAVPTLNRNHVHSIPQIVPDLAVIREFDKMAMPLLRRQRANDKESDAMAEIRDFLLTALLSGKASVMEAKTSFGEVT